MSVFTRTAAIKAFYYLMAVDGEVSGSELEQFGQIGQEILGEEFTNLKDELIDECNQMIHKTIDDSDEAYDLIAEGVDQALADRIGDPSEGVSPRLLVWNLLVMALSNDEYSKTERRLIKHIVRCYGIEKSVFLEMEQMIQTMNAVSQELQWLESSDKPYNEIRPLVSEMESRQALIRESARALIEDEIIPLEEENENHLKLYLNEKKAQVAEKVNPLAEEVGAKANEIATGVKDQAKNLFGNAKKLFKSKGEE